MTPYRQKIAEGYFRLPSTTPREADVQEFVRQFYEIHKPTETHVALHSAGDGIVRIETSAQEE